MLMTKESYNCLRNLRRHQWISRMREIRTSGFTRGAGSWFCHERCLYSTGLFLLLSEFIVTFFERLDILPHLPVGAALLAAGVADQI